MYLRHATVCKDGKTHTYWRLVRSVRRGRRVVQETVAHLGELDGEGRTRARRLALQITGRREQYELFEAAAAVGEPVAVRLEQVRLERTRRFGDVWLGWRLWQALELDRFCAAQMPAGREQVAWATMAAILVIARLCEPSSELHIAEDWYRRTALADLAGWRWSGSTTTVCTARSTGCWRTSGGWRSISSGAWASCSRSTTSCCSTT
jgi:hypothetical protein